MSGNGGTAAIADGLRAWRRGAGWSQQRAACELGCSLAAYGNWERGATPVPAAVLRLVAGRFGGEPRALLGLGTPDRGGAGPGGSRRP